jgi:hypothetical protein
VVAALVATAAWGRACSTAPIARVAPEETQATRVVTIEPKAATSSSANIGQAVASPEAGQTSTPGTIATPTSTQEATLFEEDCMAECHIPDPNESFGAGAKLLPASHDGRTTCLACHTTADAPALPDTHVGRLDESCLGCHK